MKVKKYKNMEIHYVQEGTYKYDLYDDEHRWITSLNTLKEAKEAITYLNIIRRNVPQ